MSQALPFSRAALLADPSEIVSRAAPSCPLSLMTVLFLTLLSLMSWVSTVPKVILKKRNAQAKVLEKAMELDFFGNAMLISGVR